MNPGAREFVPVEYTLDKKTKGAFNKSNLEEDRKTRDRLMRWVKNNPAASSKRLENLLRQEESEKRLERGDPTDAIASYQAEREFRDKEPYTRQAFENAMGGKKRKTKKHKKSKRVMKKTKSKRTKKSKTMRKRK